MNPQSSTSPDLLEQAHLALLRGDLGQARSLLDRLVMIEPDNVPAQELRATVVGRQAALTETARLESGDYTGAVQQAQTGSIWTRQIPDPASALLNSPTAQSGLNPFCWSLAYSPEWYLCCFLAVIIMVTTIRVGLWMSPSGSPEE